MMLFLVRLLLSKLARITPCAVYHYKSTTMLLNFFKLEYEENIKLNFPVLLRFLSNIKYVNWLEKEDALQS